MKDVVSDNWWSKTIPAEQVGEVESAGASLNPLPSRIRHYEVIRPLGAGGMGTVLLARDTRLGRLCAIKLLVDHSGDAAERFLIEARATAQLNHENIIVVYELGEHEGVPFMVLEYLPGKTLEQSLEERRSRGFSSSRAIELALAVTRALVCAHEHGIVHRDLKPSNIFITDTGMVKVLDFGIAKILQSATEGRASANPQKGAEIGTISSLTQDGALLGTMPYMAPEQWLGAAIDHRIDIWAMGLILGEMLLGRHPLAPLSPTTLLSVADLSQPMPSMRELLPGIGQLGSIIDRCLLKDVRDRLSSAKELQSELETLFSPHASGNDEVNPYCGLASFQEADANRYFGRSRAVTEAVARLRENPLLTIVGPSGVGKSSFVRAGIWPALKRSGEAYEWLGLRPGTHALAALAELLVSHMTMYSTREPAAGESDDELGNDRETIITRLRAEPGLFGALLRTRARRRLRQILIFVDQFEELYTLSPEDERATFFDCLAGAADDAGSPLRVVITIRADFLERITEAEAARIALGRSLLLLTPMDRNAQREALTRPIADLGYRFDPPELIDEMLDSLGKTSGALPLLSFAASRLWELRDTQRRTLTAESYRRVGGIAGPLSSHADAILGAMTVEQRKLTRLVMLRLVTPERTRAICTLGEFQEMGDEPMAHVLGRLVDARLLTIEGESDARGSVEIVHESLITSWPTLAQWLDESRVDAAFLTRLRNAVREWETSGENEDLLWRGHAANEASHFYEQYSGELAAKERRFLEAVLAASARAVRFRRTIVGALIGALTVVAIVVSYLALRADREAQRARIEALRADQEAIHAQIEARLGRNASRMATARERMADPTTVLSLLREVEEPEVPRGWAELARWAMVSDVAQVVSTHPDVVRYAVYSPDGKHIATASADKFGRIWKADGTGEPILLRGHTSGLWTIAFSADGKRVVTASFDKTVRVWNADGSGEPVVLRGHTKEVWGAYFHPDGKRIVSCSADKTIRIWNADGTGEPLLVGSHDDAAWSVTWSPDGRRIVTGSRDKTARIWNLEAGGEPMVLRGHDDGIWATAWSPNGKHIATSGRDNNIRLWNAEDGKEIALMHHAHWVHHLTFSPDSRLLASSSQDLTFALWNVDDTLRPARVVHGDEPFQCVEFSPDGRNLVTGSDDGTMRVWNTAESSALLVFRGHENRVISSVPSPDGKKIATGSQDGTARIWNIDRTGTPIVLRGATATVSAVAWSPDGRRLAVGSWDKLIRIYNTDGQGEPRTLQGHTREVLAVDFSPDGRRLASGSWDGTARIWDIDGQEKPLVLRGHEDRVSRAVFSPDGKRLATASTDMTARIWNADGTGEPLVLRGHEDRVWGVAWAPDGKHVVTGSWDATARIWNIDAPDKPLILRGHENWILAVAYSPDGKHIVTASQDKTVRVWNVDGSSEPWVLRGATQAYNDVHYAPDGSYIVAGSDDNLALVWKDLEPLQGVGDPRLWKASSYCLPIDRRKKILEMPDSTARVQLDACERRVREVH